MLLMGIPPVQSIPHYNPDGPSVSTKTLNIEWRVEQVFRVDQFDEPLKRLSHEGWTVFTVVSCDRFAAIISYRYSEKARGE